MDKACANCQYWQRLAGNDGQCRKHSPNPILVPVVNVFENKQVLQPASFFPPIQADSWCGEFEQGF